MGVEEADFEVLDSRLADKDEPGSKSCLMVGVFCYIGTQYLKEVGMGREIIFSLKGGSPRFFCFLKMGLRGL